MQLLKDLKNQAIMPPNQEEYAIIFGNYCQIYSKIIFEAQGLVINKVKHGNEWYNAKVNVSDLMLNQN